MKQPPRYVQIADSLVDQIESGALAVGERLTPERELSRSLGVTRTTLRQALQLLLLKGRIEKRRGAGTYVAAAKIERVTTRLNPFTRGMEQSGYLTGAEVVFLVRVKAKSIASRLRLPAEAELYYCHRVRSINRLPVMVEMFYLPVSLFPGFDRLDLRNSSIYTILESQYGITVVGAEQSLEAVAASEYEANLLNLAIGSPLLFERRVGLDQDGRPVEYAKDLYRGDRFRFLLTTRKGGTD